MKFFWKASFLQLAECDMFCVKWGADEDSAMEKWLWLLFVELWALLCPKFALQNGLKKLLFTATIWMPLRSNGDCDVLKVTWNEGTHQAVQGKQLSSRNYAAYAT